MNWVWPMAPAQEPLSCARGTSPDPMILRAAISWPSAQSRRRPCAASEAMERITSKSPWIAPKPLSLAQTAIRISRGTPKFCSMSAEYAGRSARFARGRWRSVLGDRALDVVAESAWRIPAGGCPAGRRGGRASGRPARGPAASRRQARLAAPGRRRRRPRRRTPCRRNGGRRRWASRRGRRGRRRASRCRRGATGKGWGGGGSGGLAQAARTANRTSERWRRRIRRTIERRVSGSIGTRLRHIDFAEAFPYIRPLLVKPPDATSARPRI